MLRVLSQRPCTAARWLTVVALFGSAACGGAPNGAVVYDFLERADSAHRLLETGRIDFGRPAAREVMGDGWLERRAVERRDTVRLGNGAAVDAQSAARGSATAANGADRPAVAPGSAPHRRARTAPGRNGAGQRSECRHRPPRRRLPDLLRRRAGGRRPGRAQRYSSISSVLGRTVYSPARQATGSTGSSLGTRSSSITWSRSTPRG